MFIKRAFAILATAGLSAGILIAPPAQAGTKWSGPQEVTSRLGRSISLSDSGRVAAWIRTNRSSGNGPVRTSWYLSAKKGWTPSAAIPGTAQTSAMQLSADGNYALIESSGTGYLMAQRQTKNTWTTAQTVVSGTRLANGQMSRDAGTLVWVDCAGVSSYPTDVPGVVMSQTRKADGTWNPPVTVGKASGELLDYSINPLALSGDGSTLVWLDETFALKAVTKTADGSWSIPALIKQYAGDPDLRGAMKLSLTGSRLIWHLWGEEGLLTASRASGVWTPVDYVTLDEVEEVAISPNGNVVAFGNTDEQLVLRTWSGAAWTKPLVLGSASNPTIALSQKTVAWTYTDYHGSTLRASIYAKGKWQSAGKRASAAQSPALTANGRTLAWGSTSAKRIYSVTR